MASDPSPCGIFQTSMDFCFSNLLQLRKEITENLHQISVEEDNIHKSADFTSTKYSHYIGICRGNCSTEG